jgi:hypothetical protein
MADLQGSLTGNTLNAPASAAPADDNAELDKLFAQLEEQLKTQGAGNLAAIDTMGAGQQAAIQATTPPAPEPVPSVSSPTARAIATFGAGMGSSLTRNPAMLSNMQNQIAAEDEAAGRTRHSNYASQQAYDEHKQGTLLSHQVKLLELKAEEQIKMGDRDGALQSLKAQTMIAEKLRKTHLEDDTKAKGVLLGKKLQDALTLVGARGTEARKTQAAKDTALTSGMDKAALTEYTTRAAAMRASYQVQYADLATMAGGEGANSEEGVAEIKRLKEQEDLELANLAGEIRRRYAGPVTPAANVPATPAAPGVALDADGIPIDPIRRAHWLSTHPTK